MKTNNQKHLHIYEDSDVEDYYKVSRPVEKNNPHLVRGIAVGFTLTLLALGLIAGGYRLYMALFPPR